jgi:hypothetical protein
MVFLSFLSFLTTLDVAQFDILPPEALITQKLSRSTSIHRMELSLLTYVSDCTILSIVLRKLIRTSRTET